MIYEILCTLFCFVAIFIIFIVSVQKSQGGFFGGQNNNDSSIVFGGSGGMEVFQKMTWVLGVLLMFGALFLSIYKTRLCTQGQYFVEQKKELVENKIDEIKDDKVKKVETEVNTKI